MRKHDEIALYAYMRSAANPTASTNEAAIALGICTQRAHYLVEKWQGRAWCDGVGTNYVYFTSDAPSALQPWGVA